MKFEGRFKLPKNYKPNLMPPMPAPGRCWIEPPPAMVCVACVCRDMDGHEGFCHPTPYELRPELGEGSGTVGHPGSGDFRWPSLLPPEEP